MAPHLRAVPDLGDDPGGDDGCPAPGPAGVDGRDRRSSCLAPPEPAWPPLTQALVLHRHPQAWLTRLHRRHGDVFALRLPLAGPVVLVADPAAVPRLLHADPDVARAGEARRLLQGTVSAGSVYGGDDDLHRVARDAVQPAFTREAVAGLTGGIARIARAHVATWPRGRPFQLLPRMRALTDHVLVRLVLGVEDPARGRALAAAVRRVLQPPGTPPFPVPGADGGVVAAAVAGSLARRAGHLTALLAAEVASRRADRRAGDASTPGCDVLSRLAGRTAGPTALAEQVLPLLVAGRDPAASALTWLAEQCARRPDAADAAFLDGGATTAAQAFTQESLRLRSPVPTVMRRLTAPVAVSGVELPSGTTVVLPTMLLHRDPRAFSAPDAFRPRSHAVGPVPERMLLRATTTAPHRSGLVVAAGR